MMKISEQYMSIAAQHRQEADTSTLENVRQRYLQSEARWLQMAERARQGETGRDRSSA